MDLGITVFYRETFLSSLEMGRKALEEMGVEKAAVDRVISRFMTYDEELLRKQHAVYQNEAQLIQTSRQALADLESLFEMDEKESGEEVRSTNLT